MYLKRRIEVKKENWKSRKDCDDSLKTGVLVSPYICCSSLMFCQLSNSILSSTTSPPRVWRHDHFLIVKQPIRCLRMWRKVQCAHSIIAWHKVAARSQTPAHLPTTLTYAQCLGLYDAVEIHALRNLPMVGVLSSPAKSLPCSPQTLLRPRQQNSGKRTHALSS